MTKRLRIFTRVRWFWFSLGILLLNLLSWDTLEGLDPAKPVDQYLVDQWGTAEGIPSDSIHSIAQTPDGYLWIATPKGLVRFDGMKFSTIPFVEGKTADSIDNTNTIPDTLLVDRNGTLWIGGSGVLTSYHRQTGNFKTFTTAHGLTVDRIRCMVDDMKGNLWISFFANYVNRLSNGKFTAFNPFRGLTGNKINAIVEDHNGNLLFGSRDNGVFIYKNEKFSQYPVQGMENDQVICMVESSDGVLWIGTNKGLLEVNGKETRRYTVKDGLSNDYITRIMEDSDRNFWVGTIDGLNRIKKNQDGSLRCESVLKACIITHLLEDREKSLWVGTYNSGIKRLKDGKFISYAPLEAHEGEIFQSVFESRSGDIRIGALNGKMFRCRGSDLIESVVYPGFLGAAVSSIAEDFQGYPWFGTNGNGVFQEKNGKLTRYTNREGLTDSLVTSITRDSRGNLWLSTFNGVSVIRSPNSPDRIIETLNSGNGLSGVMAHNVYEDRTQNIWIAADRGITVLKDGKIGKKNIRYYLKGVPVTCIYEDPSARVTGGRVYWIATHGAGFKRLELSPGDPLTSFTTAQGLTTDFIYQFFEDPQENFWLMSNSGILRLDKDELNRVADGQMQEINCVSFGVPDGMKSLEFNNEFSRSSALKSKNGEFWFITKKGISIVNPSRVQINKLPPPVVVEAVIFDGKPLPVHPLTRTGSYSVKGITGFEFYFTAPTFLYPGKIKFKYRLDPFDSQWISLAPGKERTARYSNLEPGSYTFRVTAANSEGVWNRIGDSITFTLKPFFYETFLFKTAVFLLLIGFAAAVFYIIKKKPFKKRMKYKGSPLDTHISETCIAKLKHLVEVKKAYSDPDISLQTLAEQLAVPPHVLSQVLNEKLNRTFSDYINFYRIEEAKRILREPPGDEKIANVALDVGFNTLAVFYTAFKKFTGMTPAQYKKEAREKK